MLLCATLAIAGGGFLVANYLVVPLFHRATKTQQPAEGGTSMTSAATPGPLDSWRLPGPLRHRKS